MTFKRNDGRTYDQVRPLLLKYNIFGYADASILYEMGNTKVLVSVSLQDSVPKFLRNQKKGWLSAEYAMLPCATFNRNIRESIYGKRNSRNVEISRFIGRCLRAVIDLNNLVEKTIVVDCDVLKADGGTRVACISAASLALKVAEDKWLKKGLIAHNILKDSIAAISVGKLNNNYLLDLNFVEDSNIDADFNFVLTGSGKLIEIQGTSEKEALSWNDFNILKELAVKGIEQLFLKFKNQNTLMKNNQNIYNKIKHNSLFSLENRLKNR